MYQIFSIQRPLCIQYCFRFQQQQKRKIKPNAIFNGIFQSGKAFCSFLLGLQRDYHHRTFKNTELCANSVKSGETVLKVKAITINLAVGDPTTSTWPSVDIPHGTRPDYTTIWTRERWFRTPRDNPHGSIFTEDISIEKALLRQSDPVERAPRKFANSINTKRVLKWWIGITII